MIYSLRKEIVMHQENAAEFGFHPGAAPGKNVRALQEALDRTGTVRVTTPGVYDLDGTVLIGSDTALECGAGVYFRRAGSFCHLQRQRCALYGGNSRFVFAYFVFLREGSGDPGF